MIRRILIIVFTNEASLLAKELHPFVHVNNFSKTNFGRKNYLLGKQLAVRVGTVSETVIQSN
jgi:hypothetical protein